ncbi:hypothetical protein JCM8097_001643 [Rhodosporidiobolus ruineniae]
MSATPRKRNAHGTPTTPTSFLAAFASTRTAISSTTNLLTSSTRDNPELLAELATLASRLDALERAAQVASSTDKAKAGSWEDELDTAGTLLWNKSTALRHATAGGSDEGNAGREELKVVAELRQIAYRLIRMGSLEPLTRDSHLSLLSLCTKACLASLAVEHTKGVSKLLKDAASHAAALLPASPPGTSASKDVLKAVLAYYCCRLRVHAFENAIELVTYAKSKLVDLLATHDMPWREVEKVAEMAYELGSKVIDQKDEKRASSIEWLQFALELLEKGDGSAVQTQQLATLKALAEAYIDGEQWKKGEETIKQILDLEPSPTMHRRLIKLILARNGGQGELQTAFVAAAASAGADADEYLRVLALVPKIPEPRRSVRFEILQSLCSAATKTALSPMSCGEVLAQILSTAVFMLAEADRMQLATLLATASSGFAGVKLPPSSAFVCVTYIWRQGDKAHQDRHFVDAAEWFLLASHELFSSIDPSVFAKSIRKAALSLIEAKENTRAEQILQLPAAGADFAKTHFVRFYNSCLIGETAKASSALEKMVTAPDFSLNQLLWAAKIANEASNKELLALVLRSIVDIAEGGKEFSGMELLVVMRCLIRLYLTKIKDAAETETEEFGRAVQHHLAAALNVVNSLAQTDPVPDSLSKDIAWLHKSSFNLCARFTSLWPLDLLVPLYDLTASLIQLEAQLNPAIEASAVGRLWMCRFAALAGRVEEARKAEGKERVKLYKALATDTQDFVDGLNGARGQNPQIEKADALLDTAYAVLVEALAGCDGWSKMVKLLEDFETASRPLPVPLLKLATDKATASTTCPRDHLCSILRKTLVLLYARQDLNVNDMALWLRLIVAALIEREPDTALEYLKNAAQVARSSQGEYPEEELTWLLSTAWEYGMDAYGASAVDVGGRWCSTAVELASSSGTMQGMAEKLEVWHDDLKRRHAGMQED